MTKTVTFTARMTEENRALCNEACNIASEELGKGCNKGQAIASVCRSFLEMQYGKEVSEESTEVLIPEVMTVEQIADMKKLSNICDRKLLKVIGGIPTCGQKTYPSGIKTQSPFIYTYKEHPSYGQVMSLDDIIATCDLCKQSFAESGKIRELIDTLTAELNENREAVLYFCRHEDLMAEVFTAFANAKFFCPFNNRNVTVSHTCLESECTNLHIERIILPPRIPSSQGGEMP